jgi:hypothetical protein
MIIQTLPGRDIFKNKKLSLLEKNISNHISAPRKIYETIYLSMMHRLAEFCQAMPFSVNQYQESFGLLERQLEIGLNVLKLRRERFFPKNADTEAITAEEAQWTFALFSVAILTQISQIETDREVKLFYANNEDIGPWSPLSGCLYEENVYYKATFTNDKVKNSDSFMAAICGRIIPAIAFRWLSQNTYLFSIWWKSLQQLDQVENDLNSVIHEVLARLNLNPSPISSKVDTPQTQLAMFLEFLKSSVTNDKQLFNSTKGLFVSEKILNDFTHEDTESLNILIKHLNDNKFILLRDDSYLHQFRSKKFDDFTILKGIILDLRKSEIESIAILCESESNYIENIKF